jgi:hypothetical protein
MGGLIDSDLDDDDEELNSEMDEIFSISPHHSDDEKVADEDSQKDSDDDIEQLAKNFGAGALRFTNGSKNRQSSQIVDFCN